MLCRLLSVRSRLLACSPASCGHVGAPLSRDLARWRTPKPPSLPCRRSLKPRWAQVSSHSLWLDPSANPRLQLSALPARSGARCTRTHSCCARRVASRRCGIGLPLASTLAVLTLLAPLPAMVDKDALVDFIQRQPRISATDKQRLAQLREDSRVRCVARSGLFFAPHGAPRPRTSPRKTSSRC